MEIYKEVIVNMKIKVIILTGIFNTNKDKIRDQ